MASTSTSANIPLQSLPLPPQSHILTQHLTPDPFTPDAKTFHDDILQTKPSLQRRARLLDAKSHFAFVSPLPYPFPYRIEIDESADTEERTKAVEKWLSDKEALKEIDIGNSTLKAYTSNERIKDYHLIGIAPDGVKDCLPSLDVGDAFDFLGLPALTAKSEALVGEVEVLSLQPAPDGDTSLQNGDAAPLNGDNPSGPSQVRQILTDILSGHTVLSSPTQDGGYAPWSLRYSGHQFGNWAGQLGDGRAISILEIPHPDNPDLTYELQLKGAGRTPFSRGADGLAVLRSSIREYLGAEAVHALGIPTTRSLALVLYPSLPVRRESPMPEKAAVVTRVAPSFIRIGNFETLSPPQNVYSSFAGDADWEALRVLGEWVLRRVLRLELGTRPDGKPPAWGRELVMEVARRNARMVAGWQAYGFMHGVMNTDNISILGLTIDYGPYAFMDIFEDNHICNHSDDEGRYAYKYQPTMIVYAVRALLSSLSPLIGAEEELGYAVSSGWADGVSKEKLQTWRENGMELQQDVEEAVLETFADEYWMLMRKRLGLRTKEPSDINKVIRSFIRLLELHELDFHSTFRTLCAFKPSLTDLEVFAARMTSESLIPSTERREAARKDIKKWLDMYANRIQEDSGEWNGEDDWMKTREVEMKNANPRFVLRQWILEEVIKKVEEDHVSGKQILAKVLQMCSNPFDSWGAEDRRPDEDMDEEIREERRYCDVGPKKFLGFQCSCSS